MTRTHRKRFDGLLYKINFVQNQMWPDNRMPVKNGA